MALGARAHFDRALYDGGEFGTSAEEEDFLGLPGLLDPDQVSLLLRKRRAGQARQRTRQPGAGAAGPAHPTSPVRPWARPGTPPAAATPAADRETLASLRKELNGLVRAWHHRSGQPHAPSTPSCAAPAVGRRCRRRPARRSGPASS